MKRIGIVTLLILLSSVLLAEDELDIKRQQAEKKDYADKSYFVVGTMPNNTGNVDGYAAVKLLYHPRLFTKLILESTSLKETQDAFNAAPLGMNAILEQEFHISAAADLLGWRMLHSGFDKPGQRISLAVIPFAGYNLSWVERRESYVFTDLVAVLNREYLLHVMQWFGKLQFTWSNPGKFFLQLHGGAGLFQGFLDQENTIYWNETGTEISDSYRADQQILQFGWRAGARLFFDTGPVAVRLSGEILQSTGDLDYIYFNITTGNNTTGSDPFKYLSWSGRIELTMNWIKLGETHPSLFYSVQQQTLQIKKAGDWVDLISDDTGTELVHKFGVMMRY